MTICEYCWAEAQKRADDDTSKSTSDHYQDVLNDPHSGCPDAPAAATPAPAEVTQ